MLPFRFPNPYTDANKLHTAFSLLKFLPFYTTLLQYALLSVLTIKRIFVFLRCPLGCVAEIVMSASSVLPACHGVSDKLYLLCNIPFNLMTDFCLEVLTFVIPPSSYFCMCLFPSFIFYFHFSSLPAT